MKFMSSESEWMNENEWMNEWMKMGGEEIFASLVEGEWVFWTKMGGEEIFALFI